ncbi:GNAT family N-acetyltransferase [Cellulomonas endometrii]|uniref:GNAT family N-acetyltransferase n=1 Tax=Cellulomonas endometrii TaxID=3036301 RepID=UPI0024AD98FF|nr:GNAT family N-acetyltransferase [Cellulomonas endometrii]
MHLRPATADDADLLTDLVAAAVNWTGEERVRARDVAADPHLARYVAGWGRPSDLGVVALDGTGEPVGAAWLRLLTADAPGWGYVADDVPELSMAVLAQGRGTGAGSALLDACLDAARQAGRRAVSLSVEDGNAVARAMYERRGFRPVGRVGGSDTLLLDLR